MKLYHHPFSSNARRAHMAAVHLGYAPELVFIDLSKGAQRNPEYLAINPNGKVPTLVDGEVVVWESLAIMTYLAQKTPGQTVYPTELVARTHADQWLFWASNHWGPTIGALTFENMLKGMFGQGAPNEYSVAKAEGLLKGYAGTLDAQLATSKFVTGDTLGLADLAIAAPLMYIGPAKLPVEGFTNIARWFAGIQQLEAWKATEPQR